MLKAIPTTAKKTLIVLIAALFVVSMMFFALPGKAYGDNQIIYVSNLQPSWTAPGGGGVFSAYVGPPEYTYESPGATALYNGREAGIIKAGLTLDPDGHYWDEGLFGFIPNVTIDTLAIGPLTYDVVNQEGTNPVWMTIEIDTGIIGDRSDDTVFQFVPTSNPKEWHTVSATGGEWQKWNNDMGDTTGNPFITLNKIAEDPAYTGRNVTRVYLRLGMGDTYHGSGSGTIAWVDKVTICNKTYDFVLPRPAPPRPLTPEEQAALDLSIERQVAIYGANNVGFTKTLYDNILGRAADDEGLNAWVTALNEGRITLRDVVFGFVFSKELEPVVSPAGPEEYITFLYKNVLNREPDPDGFNNWLTHMQNGMTKEEVLLHFVDSEEFNKICEMFGL